MVKIKFHQILFAKKNPKSMIFLECSYIPLNTIGFELAVSEGQDVSKDDGELVNAPDPIILPENSEKLMEPYQVCIDKCDQAYFERGTCHSFSYCQPHQHSSTTPRCHLKQRKFIGDNRYGEDTTPKATHIHLKCKTIFRKCENGTFWFHVLNKHSYFLLNRYFHITIMIVL